MSFKEKNVQAPKAATATKRVKRIPNSIRSYITGMECLSALTRKGGHDKLTEVLTDYLDGIFEGQTKERQEQLMKIYTNFSKEVDKMDLVELSD